VCLAGQVCASGTCALSCQAGLLACNGTCVDPATSRVFCGATADCVGAAAGKLCADGQVCSAGQCAATCGAGQVNCGGVCVDPKNDPAHCGAKADCAAANAGAVCLAGQYCSGGVCGTSCASGQVVCSGRCVEPSSDHNHCGAAGDCTGAGAGVACAADEACLSGTCIAAVAPLDLTTPFSTEIAQLPFATASEGPSFRPAAIWNGRAAPLPTNAFWQGMVSGGGNERVGFAPYQLKAAAAGLGVGLIGLQTTATVVLVPDQQQFMMGASASPTTHVVSAYDQFSVTMQYTVGAGTMTMPMVMGMPYVTVDYSNVTPKLSAGTTTFSKVNGVTTSPASGTRFTLTLGDNSSWVLYASAPITFSWNAGALTAAASFSGTLRVANVPAGNTAVLDAHAGAVPRGGTFDVSIGSDVARLHFNFATTGSGPLLVMAMPHHLPRLQGAALQALNYPSMTGTLQAVEGSTWTLRMPLSTITWGAPRAIDPARLAAVKAALTADAAYDPGAGANADPYFGGKYLAKLARLALIADEVGDTASAAALRARLTPLAAKWLGGTNTADNLVYETSWGGLVTVNGLANTGADFGQGIYNDHHYHYGYHLYAAAAVLKANPNAFTAAQMKGLLAMVRDIANPSPNDPGFTQLRMFDLFRSHSWAHGLAYPDGGHGSDQESSSEAVNAWYGLQLLGVALGDQRMADLGRLLLSLELDGARTYWQIPAASTIYPAQFAQNARCVGQLFDQQVTFQTFFGAEPWKVYGIQMIPFTPVSELLINPTWISDSWTAKMSAAAAAAQTANSGFAGLLYSSHATVDKAAAWSEVSGAAVDDGNSLTNSLWWVATRP
jgi:endo-1,3(4)-beta-glucanase